MNTVPIEEFIDITKLSELFLGVQGLGKVANLIVKSNG
jgi:hypothetical protein